MVVDKRGPCSLKYQYTHASAIVAIARSKSSAPVGGFFLVQFSSRKRGRNEGRCGVASLLVQYHCQATHTNTHTHDVDSLAGCVAHVVQIEFPNGANRRQQAKSDERREVDNVSASQAVQCLCTGKLAAKRTGSLVSCSCSSLGP